jgi:hypothetical protein
MRKRIQVSFLSSSAAGSCFAKNGDTSRPPRLTPPHKGEGNCIITFALSRSDVTMPDVNGHYAIAFSGGDMKGLAGQDSPPPCGEGLGVGVGRCQRSSHDTCAVTQPAQNGCYGSSSVCSSQRAFISEDKFQSATTSRTSRVIESASSLNSTEDSIVIRSEKRPTMQGRPTSLRVDSELSGFGTPMCSTTWKASSTKSAGNWACDDPANKGVTSRPPPLTTSHKREGDAKR